MSEITSQKLKNLTPEEQQNLVKTLKASLYPEASDNIVTLLLSYCAYQDLDPMQKPFEVMKLNKFNKQKGTWESNEVLVPTISQYRTRASRTGAYAGISEPDFGPMITETLGEETVTYPEWCRVTIHKMVQDVICHFTALEYWQENYSRKSKKNATPNDMWLKRPRAQLAKCAESQALRRAFPEMCAVPTAEEMQGKMDDRPTNEIDKNNGHERIMKAINKDHKAKDELVDLMNEMMTKDEQQAALERAGVKSVEELSDEQRSKWHERLLQKAE